MNEPSHDCLGERAPINKWLGACGVPCSPQRVSNLPRAQGSRHLRGSSMLGSPGSAATNQPVLSRCTSCLYQNCNPSWASRAACPQPPSPPLAQVPDRRLTTRTANTTTARLAPGLPLKSSQT